MGGRIHPKVLHQHARHIQGTDEIVQHRLEHQPRRLRGRLQPGRTARHLRQLPESEQPAKKIPAERRQHGFPRIRRGDLPQHAQQSDRRIRLPYAHRRHGQRRTGGFCGRNPDVQEHRKRHVGRETVVRRRGIYRACRRGRLQPRRLSGHRGCIPLGPGHTHLSPTALPEPRRMEVRGTRAARTKQFVNACRHRRRERGRASRPAL